MSMQNGESWTFFASCAPGLEPFLKDELSELGLPSLRSVAGGVEFEGGSREMYSANSWSGIAVHVLVRVAEFRALHLSQLEKACARVEWERWLPAADGVEVQASCKRSRLYHSGAVAERVTKGIAARLAARSKGPSAPCTVVARILDDHCTLSIDTSGEPLHRRGWRLQTAKAPLREDLAHALVRAAGWPRAGTFLDPLCGSGTLAIEAAGLAAGRAPGAARRFACERFVGASAKLLQSVAARPGPRVVPEGDWVVRASDRNRGAIAAARANAERAGVACEFLEADVRNVEAIDAGPLTLVGNPPWGRRVSAKDNQALMQAIGGLIRAGHEGSTASLLAPNRRLVDPTRLEFEARPRTRSGGVDVAMHLRGRP